MLTSTLSCSFTLKIKLHHVANGLPEFKTDGPSIPIGVTTTLATRLTEELSIISTPNDSIAKTVSSSRT
jgi:hypothetical protein